MSEPQMTKEQIVYELFEGKNGYIKNPENRGLTENGKCSYKTPDGKMCAVGRCLNAKGQEFGKNNFPVSSIDVNFDSIDEVLYKRYRGHSISFWNDLQKLHDDDTNWVGGFNKAGEATLAIIKSNIKYGNY